MYRVAIVILVSFITLPCFAQAQGSAPDPAAAQAVDRPTKSNGLGSIGGFIALLGGSIAAGVAMRNAKKRREVQEAAESAGKSA
jgi:hypothetical protein